MGTNSQFNKSHILLAGLGLAGAAFALQWLDYKYWTRSLSPEIYILILVVGFTALGIWTGHHISRPAKSSPDQPNEKAVEALGLTRREMAVLHELSKGHSNKQIARTLGISPNTVKTHIKNLYGKLHVTGRMQAVSTARDLGVLGN